MSGDFIFGFILGAAITAIAKTAKHRKGFKDLIVGVWERIKGKKGGES